MSFCGCYGAIYAVKGVAEQLQCSCRQPVDPAGEFLYLAEFVFEPAHKSFIPFIISAQFCQITLGTLR